MKNPVFKRLYMGNDVMFGFWFDFEMQILTDDVKEILVQMVREYLEKYGKEELLEFVDSYEDRIHCLKQFEDQLSTIMNEIIIDYSKENIYACSFSYGSDINAVCLIANTKDELKKHMDEDFFYYKYCEEEWEIWNIKEKELTNLLLRTNEKLKSKKMLPVYRY